MENEVAEPSLLLLLLETSNELPQGQQCQITDAK